MAGAPASGAGGDLLAIRLVYDGPPHSGKTTTLAALAGSLARPMESPEEAFGRTLFFDWVEYVGGSFDGQPIRCQIVSVPGQRALARRRRALLSTADVVVLVADTTAAGLGETAACLASLQHILAVRQGPPIGLVLQANKRDAPDALPLGALRDRLALAGAACVESVATAGTGVREAFVLAVRLALDRVREQLAAGVTPARPDAASAGELLAQVKAHEAAFPPQPPVPLPPAVSMLREVLAHEDPAGRPGAAAGVARPHGAAPPPLSQADAATGPPAPGEAVAEPAEATPPLPDSAAPSGRVWPPVEGRVLLHEAPAAAAPARRQADGAWLAAADGWRFHSHAGHRFADLEEGRQELLRWARLHSAGLERLSQRRCLVLADSGAGGWRLWQIVAPAETLQGRLVQRLLANDPRAAAQTLVAVAGLLLRAHHMLASEPRLPCRVAAIGVGPQSNVVYAGLLPPPQETPETPETPESTEDGEGTVEGAEGVEALLRREIAPVLRKVLPESPLDVARTLDAVQADHPSTPEGRRIRETLAALLIES